MSVRRMLGGHQKCLTSIQVSEWHEDECSHGRSWALGRHVSTSVEIALTVLICQLGDIPAWWVSHPVPLGLPDLGPFESLEAAKAAALLLYGDKAPEAQQFAHRGWPTAQHRHRHLHG